MSDPKIDLEDLLVGQVSALVTATADMVREAENAEQAEQEHPFAIEERFYRALAANCELKADLCKKFAAVTDEPTG